MSSARIQTLCSKQPHHWDLDVVDLPNWLGAIQTCWSCPLLDSCRTERDQFYPHRAGPRSVIWAGTAYNERGKELSIRQLRRRAFVHPGRSRAS